MNDHFEETLDPGGHDPRPEEIREHCRRIREEWTATTRRRRTARKSGRWQPPTVTVTPERTISHVSRDGE